MKFVEHSFLGTPIFAPSATLGKVKKTLRCFAHGSVARKSHYPEEKEVERLAIQEGH